MFDFLHKKAQDATPPALPEGTVRRRYSTQPVSSSVWAA